jgi:hypothetical protein
MFIYSFHIMDSFIQLYETSKKVKSLLNLQSVKFLKSLCLHYSLNTATSGVRGKAIKPDYIDALVRYVSTLGFWIINAVLTNAISTVLC